MLTVSERIEETLEVGRFPRSSADKVEPWLMDKKVV